MKYFAKITVSNSKSRKKIPIKIIFFALEVFLFFTVVVIEAVVILVFVMDVVVVIRTKLSQHMQQVIGPLFQFVFKSELSYFRNEFVP